WLCESIRQAQLRPTASPGESAIANIDRIDGVTGYWNTPSWKQTALARRRKRVVLKNGVGADEVIATRQHQSRSRVVACMHAIDVERLHAFLPVQREVAVRERVRRRYIGEPAQDRARGAVKHIIIEHADGVSNEGRRRSERATLYPNERPRSRQLLRPEHGVVALKRAVRERHVRAVFHAHLAGEI